MPVEPAVPLTPASTTGMALGINGVSHTFPNGVEALRDINLQIAAGEFVAILGPSGCGKSTLLRIIADLARPTSGTVTSGLQAAAPPAEVSYESRRRPPTEIAYVFQDAHLLPWRTVLKNAALPLELQGVPETQRLTAAMKALQVVGLGGFENRHPSQLSGGMRMRVSIARALVTRPRLLLMDEPFAALDEITRQRLDDMLRKLWAETGMTVLFVTHSTEEATFLANRAIVMSRRPGRIIFDEAIDLPSGRSGAVRGEAAFGRQTRMLYEALEQGEAMVAP